MMFFSVNEPIVYGGEIIYSNVALQTFASNPVAMYAVGDNGVIYPGGYDDTTYVTQDDAYTNFYRIDTTTGTYTTHSQPAGLLKFPFTVNESGDVYWDDGSTKFWKVQPDDTQKYFTKGIGLGDYGTVQTPINTGPDLVCFNVGSVYLVSSIDYTAHTATLSSNLAIAGFIMAKQNANISGGRVYCATAAAIGYIDTVTPTVASLASVVNIGSEFIVGGDVNLYCHDGLGSVYKYDNAGTLLGTVSILDAGVATYHLACYTDDGSLWAWGLSATGTMWWKIKVSDMTVTSTGTLDKHSSLFWSMAIGTRFADQTSPVLFTSNGADFYLGKMVPA